MALHDEFLATFAIAGKEYTYVSLNKVADKYGFDIKKLPYSLRVLLENLVRHLDGNTVKEQDIKNLVARANDEIAYRPYRVLMQDFTGVPAVVDLAAMRDAMVKLGGNAEKINPLSPVDLVIDHSVQVDVYGKSGAFKDNVDLEMERNGERYEFLRWGQKAFKNFRVVPPGTGICHQVNLEYLATVVVSKTDETTGAVFTFPDTCVGTDSHTTMVNGLSVLGWGVGGIEAEAAMLGQPVSMLIPDVVGFKLTGELKEGVTATDLVLTVTQMLRAKGVVGKFVEFYGPGLHKLALADRATIANMAPEYGATCGFFPIDNETIKYLNLTGRPEEQIALVEIYAKDNHFWHGDIEPDFTDTLELDMGTVVSSLAGPKRPQDKVALTEAASGFKVELAKSFGVTEAGKQISFGKKEDERIEEGDVVIAAITSCTNTSNPSVLVGAGLMARKAAKLGLVAKPWVKTSLAPGSKVVTEYLEVSGLMKDLNDIGFYLVGYGCTTCIGNSGPLLREIETAIKDNNMTVAAVLSGNRNFEGRVHPLVKANYLASPPLVVAYALAGSMKIDITTEPLGHNKKGEPVYLKDVWPTDAEIAEVMAKFITRDMFMKKYANVFEGDSRWKAIKVAGGETYSWNNDSTYIQNPPYFEGMSESGVTIGNITGARVVGIFGDSITTDHISPAGNIAVGSPAALYLESRGVQKKDWNQYGARRGSHEVMMRGTFANIRIKNLLADGKEGGWTKYIPTGEIASIYDACMKYQAAGTPLVVFAGKEYGTGSSRDWAAKGTKLLGIKAVIAESFERIHRSNLVGMGVLPLVFKDGQTKDTLKIDGSETFDIIGLENGIKPKMDVTLVIKRKDGKTDNYKLLCRVDTNDEVGYIKAGGILHKVLLGLK